MGQVAGNARNALLALPAQAPTNAGPSRRAPRLAHSLLRHPRLFDWAVGLA